MESPPPDPDELASVVGQMAKLVNLLVGYFEDRRGAELEEDLVGPYRHARETVETMLDDVGGIEVWLRYLEAVESLRQRGWAGPLGFSIDHRLADTDVPVVLENALYSAWHDAVVAEEPVLREARGDELDATLARFRQLDRDFITDAAERVVDACVARRPRTNVGMASIIEKENQEAQPPQPVRTLLTKTADVVRALKPCFMMSPLSVSQFLPAEFRFDVVVFDEASQITPADAVNCIYRGRQLIVAGDDRQLPPTSFFQRGALDDDSGYEEGQFDDFESVLGLVKGTAGLQSLPLRWHCRSQHESLITFSNYRFRHSFRVVGRRHRPPRSEARCFPPAAVRCARDEP